MAIRTSLWIPQAFKSPTEGHANRGNSKKNKRHEITASKKGINKSYTHLDRTVSACFKYNIPNPRAYPMANILRHQHLDEGIYQAIA